MSVNLLQVFQIHFDVTRFQVLLIDGDDEFSAPYFELLKFAKGTLADCWNPPPVYADRPTLLRPDIHLLVGSVGMVLGQRAMAELADISILSGELLPLPFEGNLMHFLNVTSIINCLDGARTTFDPIGVAQVLEFLPHRLPEESLFRIPENNAAQLFCSQGLAGLRDFKRQVEESGLTGVNFEEVWSNRHGGFERPTAW